jgi:SAM-dependent methyltransferase
LEGKGLRPIGRTLLRAARRVRSFPSRVRQFGGSRPLSRAYGFDRGTPIDRFYIEAFLERHSQDIRGHVLEVGDDSYSRRFGGDRITAQDVLHIHSGNPTATIVGDLADPGTLPTERFDCIILTQTLQYVFDLEAAVANIRRSLRAGGVALISVPAISPLCEDEWKASHYWLFTSLAVQRLLAADFDREKISVADHGNLYAATAFLHGAAVEEVNRKKLRQLDNDYPVTITARAVA